MNIVINTLAIIGGLFLLIVAGRIIAYTCIKLYYDYIFYRYIRPSWKKEHEIWSNPATSDAEKETQWKEWSILNNKQLSDDEKRELWALWIKNKESLNKT